jgi:hypothetical protein
MTEGRRIRVSYTKLVGILRYNRHVLTYIIYLGTQQIYLYHFKFHKIEAFSDFNF